MFLYKTKHWTLPEMVSMAEPAPVEDGSGSRWIVRSGRTDSGAVRRGQDDEDHGVDGGVP